MKCAKHAEIKKKAEQNEARERDIAVGLQRHDEATRPRGKTLHKTSVSTE